MSGPEMDRLEMEMELLEAMFPDQTTLNIKSREFRFSDGTASLLLRLPQGYPATGFPDVIFATDTAKNDLRAHIRAAVKELGLAEGDEALDAIIAAFQQTLKANQSSQEPRTNAIGDTTTKCKSKTVIVWLHHLLNTNKRKLALSPTNLSGLTKPGYPGILIFSGSHSAVTEHVNTLKAQNWQAFQVRYDEDELWSFAHGLGVKEVESMSEIVKGVGDLSGDEKSEKEKGEEQKKEFLKAVGIK
ncbi:hypothetical protein BKA66DRAFT_120488 [Pyrenochaeta sp. MPI-SDFR-AT-0127]|nr:hypothetical protein BKA66DRAFT_120488 [Pyrenochaeta sp. MPI-SDFR-AT-0127]